MDGLGLIGMGICGGVITVRFTNYLWVILCVKAGEKK